MIRLYGKPSHQGCSAHLLFSLPSLPENYLIRIVLCFPAVRAATALDVGFQLLQQPLCNFRMRCIEVGGLTGVLFQVVELRHRTVRRDFFFGGEVQPPEPLARQEFPFALAIGKVPADGMVDHAGPRGDDRLAEQGRQKTDTVFRASGRQRLSRDLAERGKQIGQANQLVTGRSRGNLPGPADDERNTVAAIPQIGLGSAKMGADPMSLRRQLWMPAALEQPLSLLKMTSVFSVIPCVSNSADGSPPTPHRSPSQSRHT